VFPLTLAIATLLGVPPQAAAQSPGTAPTTIQGYLDAWRNASGVPGVAVGIVTKDGKVTGYAAGESDTTTHRKMEPTDLMLAGSVGKTFFAAVALRLIGEGKLDLDAPVSKYLGMREWFPRLPNSKDVTVRQLMTHTSGIVRYEFNEKFTADLRAAPDKVWRPEEQIAYLFDTIAPFAAGQGFEYSDTNYLVLGLIIEHITGARYYDLIRDRFLKPFDLKSAVPSDRRSIPGLVNGYVGANDPILPAGPVMKDGAMTINPQMEWAGGGFATSPIDLARWGHELYRGRALNEKARRLMIDAAPPVKPGGAYSYGLGVMVRPPATSAGMTSVTWGHSGYFPGYMTELMHVVDTGMTLAIQVNSSAPRTPGSASLARVLYDLSALAGQ
jgi:D-alanyl-D-alanine carboxypeptidase